MDCREFHRNHGALLDDSIPALMLVRAQRHMTECARCADHDASVRRALLVFRNLPTIEPSRRFSEQLNARLAHARISGSTKSQSLFPTLSAVVVAAGLLLTIGLGITLRESSSDLSLAPALALEPEAAAPEFMAPAIAASMSTGIPAWPAVWMLEKASQQLADAELHFATYTPR